MSEKQPLEVYKSIVAITGELAKEGIAKKQVNQQQGFKYRGIDAVYAALSPLLASHQLCILPRIISKEVVERVNAKGTALFYTTVEANFDVVSAVDGSTHTVISYGEAMDSGDKSIGKAMSYAYKAMAFMLFAIPTEGDNDPDAQTHEVQPQNKPTQAAKPSPPADGMPKVNQALYDELAAWCKGDTDNMDTVLKRLSYYKTGDEAKGEEVKEYSFGLDRLPKTSEKWAGKVLTALKKMIEAETAADTQIDTDDIPF